MLTRKLINISIFKKLNYFINNIMYYGTGIILIQQNCKCASTNRYSLFVII